MVKTKNSERKSKANEIVSKKVLPARNKKSSDKKNLCSLKAVEKEKVFSQKNEEFDWNLIKNILFIGSTHVCSICSYNYESDNRIPICLPCGHTICKICVNSLKHTLLTGFCPFDRKEFFYIEALLPVNYALLNSPEKFFEKICKIHGMQIIGFCKDHNEYICGRCIFLHRSHNFYEIETFQAHSEGINSEKLL